MKQQIKRALGMVLVLAMILSLLPTAAFARMIPAEVTDPEVLGYAYWNKDLSYAERAADLISHMTLEEKVNQLVSHPAAAIDRLGVAEYWYPGENLNGIGNIQWWYGSDVADTKSAASAFTSTLTQGSTWNPDLIAEMADAIGDEARVFYNQTNGSNGRNKGLSHWGPSVNLARDPRWGRTGDSFGEDVILSGEMGSAFVRGFQGDLDDTSDYLKAIACIKHFAANNAEAVRSNGSSNMSETELREFYLRHFEMMVEDSDPACVMGAYNAINGIPCHGNYELLTSILRLTWGFDGWVVSDNSGVENLYDRYGVTSRNSNSKYDDQEKFPVLNGYERTWNGQTIALEVDSIAEAAAAAINAGVSLDLHTLPSYYTRGLGEAVENGLTTEDVLDQSLLEVLTTRFATGEFDFVDDYTEGYESEAAMIRKYQPLAEELANQGIVMLENNGILPLNLSKYKNVVIVGQYIEELLYSDYKSVEGWRIENGIDISFSEGIKDAVDEYNKANNKNIAFTSIVLMEDENGGVSFPDADDSDKVQGYNSLLSSKDTLTIYVPSTRIVALSSGADAGESHDRVGLELPRGQADLENMPGSNGALAHAANLVVMMHTQSIVDVDFAKNSNVDALLWASYLGEKQGPALANILTGKANPSGHLTTTWYSDESQLAELQHDYSIYDDDGEGTDDYGRTYMYFTGDYDYPFGYGLSYSTFEYSNFSVDATDVTGNSTVNVTVTVTNTSDIDGADVLQVYAAGPKADDPHRPMQQLVTFQRVEVPAGKSVDVTMSFDMLDLANWNTKTAKFEMDLGAWTVALKTNADTVAQYTMNVNDSIADYIDVPDGKWYYKAIMAVTKAGLMNGTGDNKFSPEQNVKRGELVTVLYRMAGSPTVSGKSSLSDIEGRYYTNAIKWAESKGITTGYPDGTFRPEKPVTREEMVTFIYRYVGVMGGDTSKSAALTFTDSADVANYAKMAMQWAVAADVIHGTTQNTVNPKKNATRADFATVVNNFVKPGENQDAVAVINCTADISPALKAVTAGIRNYILNKGEKQAITVSASTAADHLYATKGEMPSTYTVTYESSNTKVATVDANGNVSAVAPGVCTITVTVTDSATGTTATGTHPIVVQ